MQTIPAFSSPPRFLDLRASKPQARPGGIPVCGACGICGERIRDVGCPVRDRLHHTRGMFRMVKCTHCGHRQLGRPLSREQMRQAYSQHYLVRGMNGSGNDSWRSRLLKKHVHILEDSRVRFVSKYYVLNEETRILDVGCGNATFIDAAKRLGCASVAGIELDEESVKTGRGRGLNLHGGTLPGMEKELGKFDIITLWHVLEHTADPVKELRAVRQVLKPGGYAFVGVPDAGGLTARLFGQYWFGADIPRHMHQFTVSELALASEQAALRCMDCRHVTEAPTVAGSLHNLLGRRWWDDIERHLLRWLLLCALTLPLDHLLRALGLGDWMIMVLKREETKTE